MRTSHNPAFRNLPAASPYAGFNSAPGYDVPGYAGPQTGVGQDRPMTIDDVVMKTGASIGTALLTGVAAAIWAKSQVVAETAGALFPVMIVSMLVGLGLALFIAFKQKASAPLTLAYSAVEGVFLGVITGIFELMVPGVALQAIMGTAIVFVVMLVVYKTGAVKVTPKLRKWVIGAAMGALGLMLVNLVLGMFGVNMGIRDAGPLGIIVSLVFIGIAAFMLLLDFDMADNMIRAGMPQKWAWYAAFGLMTTLVWLYLEMLRLLASLQSE